MKLYVWYSPKLDRIELLPTEECKERPTCRWDKCAMIKFFGSVRKHGAFYYIGEL